MKIYTAWRRGLVLMVAFLLVLPFNTSAAPATGNLLGEGQVFEIAAKNGSLAAFMYAPKGWEVTLPEQDGVHFRKSIPNQNIEASIDVMRIVPGDILKTDNNKGWAQKKNAWIVKNYIPKTIMGALDIDKKTITRGRVIIDNTVGEYIKYNFGDQTNLQIVFQKSGSVYVVHVQTPATVWSQNEKAIEQSLGSLSIRKLGLPSAK